MPRPRLNFTLTRGTIRKLFRAGVVVAGIIALFWSIGCMERLFYLPTRETIPLSLAPAGAEEVRFRSADGTALHGWLIPALGNRSRLQDSPTILHVHGNAGNIRSHIYFTEHLPLAGFNVFIFDYRGYGESEGKPTRRAALIDDTEAALQILLRRDDLDHERIGLYGQSLGAAIGLSVMASRSEIRAAVLESPFASWRDIAANAVGGDPPFFLARWLAAILISDEERPLDAIATIDSPILLLHGDSDSIIPVTHSRRLRAAGGDHVQLIVFPGGEHNSLRDTHPEADRLMIQFFRQHLSRSSDGAVDGQS